MITNDERLQWLIAHGYAPAKWRPATLTEMRMGIGTKNGQVMVGEPSIESIDAAMTASERAPAPTSAAAPEACPTCGSLLVDLYHGGPFLRCRRCGTVMENVG